jgi:hypothetical protein
MESCSDVCVGVAKCVLEQVWSGEKENHAKGRNMAKNNQKLGVHIDACDPAIEVRQSKQRRTCQRLADTILRRSMMHKIFLCCSSILPAFVPPVDKVLYLTQRIAEMG